MKLNCWKLAALRLDTSLTRTWVKKLWDSVGNVAKKNHVGSFTNSWILGKRFVKVTNNNKIKTKCFFLWNQGVVWEELKIRAVIGYPKNPWTLQWKGLNLYSRGPGPQISHFWGVRILRVLIFWKSFVKAWNEDSVQDILEDWDFGIITKLALA